MGLAEMSALFLWGEFNMMEILEDRFFNKYRWKSGYECLNLRNIEEPPEWYSGNEIEWLQELTTFIYLYSQEWNEIYQEYINIVQKNDIRGNYTLHYYRDDEGYLRKYGEPDILLKISITGEDTTVRKLLKQVKWLEIMTIEEYLQYVQTNKQERKKYIPEISARVQQYLDIFNGSEECGLEAQIAFVSSPDVSSFKSHDIFIDPLNETYFIL